MTTEHGSKCFHPPCMWWQEQTLLGTKQNDVFTTLSTSVWWWWWCDIGEVWLLGCVFHLVWLFIIWSMVTVAYQFIWLAEHHYMISVASRMMASPVKWIYSRQRRHYNLTEIFRYVSQQYSAVYIMFWTTYTSFRAIRVGQHNIVGILLSSSSDCKQTATIITI